MNHSLLQSWSCRYFSWKHEKDDYDTFIANACWRTAWMWRGVKFKKGMKAISFGCYPRYHGTMILTAREPLSRESEFWLYIMENKTTMYPLRHTPEFMIYPI